MEWHNELRCGDSAILLNQLPEIVDLVVTSPPYDDLRSYDSGSSFQVEPIIKGLYKCLKPGGVVVWVISDRTHNGSESLSSFKQAIAFREFGFNVHDTMIYAKENPIPMNHRRYEQVFEYMFVFSKGSPKTFNPIKVPVSSPLRERKDAHHTRNYSRGNKLRGHKTDKIKGNIWYYTIGYNSSTRDVEAFEHPAIFPDQLARDQISSWSNPGDLVLDPMCGSGTTCKMAAEMGRQYLGFDLSPKYIDIATRRLERLKSTD